MIDRPTEDYAWLVKHVFIPAMAEIMREEHTAALVNGSPLPRARRRASTRRHRSNRTRRISQVPG
jgi:hypothetical protein